MLSRQYLVGARVMVYMPSEDKGKRWKLALPYHGPYRIVEVRSKTLLVRPVDVPTATPMLANKSWIGPRRKHQKWKDRSAVETQESDHPPIPTLGTRSDSRGCELKGDRTEPWYSLIVVW